MIYAQDSTFDPAQRPAACQPSAFRSIFDGPLPPQEPLAVAPRQSWLAEFISEAIDGTVVIAVLVWLFFEFTWDRINAGAHRRGWRGVDLLATRFMQGTVIFAALYLAFECACALQRHNW